MIISGRLLRDVADLCDQIYFVTKNTAGFSMCMQRMAERMCMNLKDDELS